MSLTDNWINQINLRSQNEYASKIDFIDDKGIQFIRGFEDQDEIVNDTNIKIKGEIVGIYGETFDYDGSKRLKSFGLILL